MIYRWISAPQLGAIFGRSRFWGYREIRRKTFSDVIHYRGAAEVHRKGARRGCHFIELARVEEVVGGRISPERWAERLALAGVWVPEREGT
jgi:hypothetical protein